MATLRARSSFHAPGRFIADGDELDSTDPIVKGREALFDTVESDAPAGKVPAKKAVAKKAVAKKTVAKKTAAKKAASK